MHLRTISLEQHSPPPLSHLYFEDQPYPERTATQKCCFTLVLFQTAFQIPAPGSGSVLIVRNGSQKQPKTLTRHK